jgi:hypothetical protein
MSEVLREEQTAVKTAFLSYYISMYNTVNKEVGYPDAPVTVDEIYDFIQDFCNAYIFTIYMESLWRG